MWWLYLFTGGGLALVGQVLEGLEGAQQRQLLDQAALDLRVGQQRLRHTAQAAESPFR